MELGPIFEIERDILYIKGEIKGKLEGKIEGKLETALNLKSMGLPIADIAKATGLSIEEIEQL